MPLSSGKSKSAFSHNVAAEKNAGKPTAQAVAIAYAKKRGDCSVEMDDAEIEADDCEIESSGAADMALDRAMHRIDTDGHLHIEGANISKAMICPYLGGEIPQSDELGLDPSRVYYLYRDAAELEAAAKTYTNKPLMADHIAVSAEQPYKHYVAGAVSNIRFSFPYLKADIAVWNSEDIARIQSGEKQEISCGYKYRADMTPGQFEGQKYDGVMRELACNHIALVEAGRCGPDVTAAAT